MTAETLKLLRGWLSAFGASVDDEGHILRKDGKKLRTKITSKGGRMQIVAGADPHKPHKLSNLVFSGPLAQDALHAFVTQFWYWEKKVRWQEAGLFTLSSSADELIKAVRACQFLMGFDIGRRGEGSQYPVSQQEIAELMDVYRHTDVHGNVWQLYLDGDKLYEVCHELMEPGKFAEMFGNG